MGDMANLTTVERIYRRSVSAEVWDQAWAEATARDVHDTQVRKLYMTFRANLGAPTADTYLCVHADGSVCVDGKQGAPNTKFRVLNVFPIEKNYYQIICREGECKDFILYVENSTLKARIDDFMLQLFYLFKWSDKKWKGLQDTASIVEDHILKPSKSQGTRWIGHRVKALKVLDRNYRSLRLLFEDMGSGQRSDITGDVSAQMRGYLRKFKSKKFVAYLGAYLDLTEELEKLSSVFQAEDLPITSVRSSIEVATLSLQALLDGPGHHQERLNAEMVLDEDECLTFRGMELENSDFSSGVVCETVITDILRCLNDRFANLYENPVFLSFDIFDPSNFPQSKEELSSYGKDSISFLMNHFRDILTRQECQLHEVQREWLTLKLDIFRNHPQQDFLPMWQNILNEKRHKYPNILHLVHIALVCPVATAHVERQFSTIKRILGYWRLSLGLMSCERLLRISTEGPSIADFCPSPSVKMWYADSVCGRRPDNSAAPTSHQYNVED